MSKYKNIAIDIVKRIENGEFDNSNKLPIEGELIRHYQASRNTIRLAMKELIKEGKVYSRQGSGYFIRKRKNKNRISITGTNGLTHDFPNSKFETKVLSVELIKANQEIADNMLCEVGTEIYYIKRLRIIDDNKYALEYTYYNKEIVSYLDENIAAKSIYNYLQNDLNLKFGFADKDIYALKLTKEQAELLELNEGDPGLVIEDTVYLENGQLFNTSIVIYNYKFANFYATAIR